MKKVFFAFAVVAGIAMTACNNKPAEDATKTADTTAVTTTTTATAPVAADTTAPAPAADTTKPAATETKTEKKEEVKKK